MNQSMFVLSLFTVKENQKAQCGKDGFRETWVYGRGGMTRQGDIACAKTCPSQWTRNQKVELRTRGKCKFQRSQ